MPLCVGLSKKISLKNIESGGCNVTRWQKVLFCTASCCVLLPAPTSVSVPATEYFFHVAKLNQLLVLSQQLEEDIRHLGSHKYIAHQLSVLYVRMANLSSAFFPSTLSNLLNSSACSLMTSFYLFFPFEASHQLLPGNPGLFGNKEGDWDQLQTDEAVPCGGGRLPTRASADSPLHQLVSRRVSDESRRWLIHGQSH